MLLDWGSHRRKATRKRKHLHVVYLCQSYAKLTTGTPGGLRRVGHTDQELYASCKRARVSTPLHASMSRRESGSPHLRRVSLHLQGSHRKQIFLAVEEGAWIENRGRRDVLQTVHDLVSAATMQLGVASGTFSDGTDDYYIDTKPKQTARERERWRIKNHYAPTAKRWTRRSVTFQAVRRADRRTVIVIYGLRGERLDRKRVRDYFDGPSGRAVFAFEPGGRTGLGMLGC